MIFLPEKDKCKIWHIRNSGEIFIKWLYNNDENFSINFLWNLEPYLAENEQIKYKQSEDPFYLSVIECMKDPVLPCTEPACKSYPQLRYNNIIKKWFCNCSSSAICTENNDESEVNELLKFDIQNNRITSEYGYCETPIEAILYWNKMVLNDLITSNNENFVKIKKQTK